MNQERKEELLKQGIDNGNFPQTLYKYRTIEQTEKILNNFSFWFATPDSFNDPFDCNLSEIEPPSLSDAKKHFESIGVSGQTLTKSLDLYNKDPNKLIELVKTVKEKTIFSKGVLSLSEKHDDILMWSHYSDYHQGIVIGLNMEIDIPFFISPIRIDYQDQYETLNYLSDPNKSTIDTLKIKSSQWEYENEIRIYKNNSGLHQIDKKAITEIYFGIKTSEVDIDKIKNICKSKNLNHINFFKGSQGHGTFDIKFKSI